VGATSPVSVLTDYYLVPVFYPLTYREFSCIVWTAPWFGVVNYALLAAVLLWLYRTRRTGRAASS
jgi:hypothetical protein